MLQLQRNNQGKAYRQAKKNYSQTDPYVHLTLSERQRFINDVADCVSAWGSSRLFAECIDKVHFNPQIARLSLGEQAFEQLISRFERYLQNIDGPNGQRTFGLLVHDNNETVARRHTQMMRTFHQRGTLWIKIQRIIETPLLTANSPAWSKLPTYAAIHCDDIWRMARRISSPRFLPAQTAILIGSWEYAILPTRHASAPSV
ncbi:MAG: hypothetical protein OXH76_23665 [Boseongicola sp.]|nr:hypothetical protein [Boseongicola sp.]